MEQSPTYTVDPDSWTYTEDPNHKLVVSVRDNIAMAIIDAANGRAYIGNASPSRLDILAQMKQAAVVANQSGNEGLMACAIGGLRISNERALVGGQPLMLHQLERAGRLAMSTTLVRNSALTLAEGLVLAAPFGWVNDDGLAFTVAAQANRTINTAFDQHFNQI